MSDSSVGVTNEASGAGVAQVDVTLLTVNGVTVVRQRIVLADPVNAEQFANVTSAGALQVDASATTQPVSAAKPTVGAGAFVAGQVALAGASAVQIVAARNGAPGTGRVSLTINNLAGATIYIGGAGVTAANGLPLTAGESITLATTAAVYACLAAAGTPTIGFIELY